MIDFYTSNIKYLINSILDLINVTNEKIKQVELSINNRPIRKFNYLSPIETLNNKFVALMN
jgi:IS30 family transposase